MNDAARSQIADPRFSLRAPALSLLAVATALPRRSGTGAPRARLAIALALALAALLALAAPALAATEFKLTVAKFGVGSGTITGGSAAQPSTIGCGATCEHQYVSGEEVTLEASPAAGSEFTGWLGGGCSGTGTCTVKMSEARRVEAEFAPEGGGSALPPTYKEAITTAGASNFLHPWGLAFDGSGNLFVADSEAKLVYGFNSSGSFTGKIPGTGTFPEEYTRSVASSRAAGGNLYVAESGPDEIYVFKPTGGGSYANIQQLSRDSAGFFYLAFDNSSGSHAGYLYTTHGPRHVKAIPTVAEGKLEEGEGELPPPGEQELAPPPEGFEMLVGLHDHDGGLTVDAATSSLYIANGAKHRVDVYDTDTASASEPPTFSHSFGGAATPSGANSFEPVGVAVDEASGLIYVLDGHSNVTQAVDVFSESGRYQGQLEKAGGGNPFQFGSAYGLAVQSAEVSGKGQVYVSDGTKIDVFNPGLPGGKPQLTLNKAGSGRGTVTSSPIGIDCGPACSVEAAEFETGQQVTLTAEPTSQSEFAGWHGPAAELAGCDETGATLDCEVEMSAALEIDAVFDHIEHPATIDSTSVSAVTSTSATLETEINPHDLPTTYRFEYDTAPYAEGEAPHGLAVPVPDASAGSGEAEVLRTAQLHGLIPATLYHYRVVAHNSLGTVEGEDHAFTTQGIGAFGLPDGRQWEQVSPPNKHGAPLPGITEEGAVIQAAADGDAFTYVAQGPLGPEAPGTRSPSYNQLLSKRGPAGWSTQDISAPHEEVVVFHPGNLDEYNFYSEDLSTGLIVPFGQKPLSNTPYRREASGEFVPLLDASNLPPETEDPQAAFQTATPDLSHVLLTSPKVLAPGFQPGFEPHTNSLYEVAGGAVALVSILPNGEPAAEAGLGAASGGTNNHRGVISNDGQRVVFEAGDHLYLRDLGLAQTVELDGGAGSPKFQIASGDGSKVFFTDTARLTPDASSSGADLYMCEVKLSPEGDLSCDLSDLSANPNPGEAAKLGERVSALDASAEHVFFAAGGVLTEEANARGEEAVPGTCKPNGESSCNLYVYNTASRKAILVAVLSRLDAHDWLGSGTNFGELTARSSPNGRFFSFMSERPLTGYDNRDAHSGELDEEVFLYDTATEALHCASCNPTGARPHGVYDPETYPPLLADEIGTWEGRWIAANIPGWTTYWLGDALYQSRYLSNSGRLFFNTPDALAPKDVNGVMDVYQYEPPGVGSCTESSPSFGAASGGCVDLISSGTSPEESAFMDASESGDNVFFLTASRLSSTDIDTAPDVYDAHACSAESPCTPPLPPPPPACAGDACQLPVSPPNDPTPGSLTFHGSGNVHEAKPRKKHKKNGKHKHRRKAHKSRKRAADNRRANR